MFRVLSIRLDNRLPQNMSKQPSRVVFAYLETISV